MNGNVVPMDIKTDWKNKVEMKKRERRGVVYQILMSLSANFVIIGPAMGFGYSAVALGPLRSESSDVQINLNQANWIATSSALGIPVGCVLSSFLMRRGRKLTLLMVSIISFIGWIIIYMSNSYEQILIGRIISGIGTGLASIPATVYSGEIANVKWRGTMVTWTGSFIALGVLIVYLFGCIFKDDWRMIALMCSLFPILSIALILIVLPESPMWYRERGRLEEAVETLKKFRGIPKEDSATMEILLELKPNNQQRPKKNIMKHLFRRNAMIPFAIMLIYFLFQQFSGIFVMVYYAVDIVQSAGIKLDPYLGAVFIGLARFIGSIVIALFSSKYGRRVPSIVSGSGMTLSMGLLSVYLLMNDKGYDVIKDGGIIPVICVVTYIFLSTLGFLSIPFAMIGEIYPSKVKDILSGLTTCITYIFSSITIKTYPNMLLLMGKHGVFFFYAIVSLLGTLFILFFLPETKGKSLNEIEQMFNKKIDNNVLESDGMVAMVSNGVENMPVEHVNVNRV